MSRLRVLWVTNLPAPYRYPVWSAIKGVDLRVAVLARTEPNRHWDIPEEPTVPTTLLPCWRPYFRGRPVYTLPPGRLPEIRRCDVVLLGGWEHPAYWQLRRHARRSGVRVAGFYESTLASHAHATGPVAAARSAFFRGLDAVLTPGAAATDALLAMGVRPDRIVTGVNAVDVSAIRAEVSARPEADGSAHRFLYVGQLIERKNVSALLQALAQVDAEATLDVVGEGHLRDRLREEADALGVAGRVRWHGHLAGPDLLGRYAQAHTLVLPSQEEVWGLVVNEALAAGLHVVVSDCAGVAEAVADEPGVWSCPPVAPALVLAMRDSMRCHPGRRLSRDELLDRLSPRAAADAAERALALAASGARP